MKFIKGADVSSLQAMEACGAKFYDLDGKADDALAILQRHGVNYIRLRLFNRPTQSFDGGDYCDLVHTVQMAKRVKARGLGFLLDFHYSDFWADWKSQTIPADWKDQSAGELEKSVYRFTKDALLELERANARPDMVQVGNEIGRGILWEYGGEEHMLQLAAFLNAGLAAVREVSSAQTMLHLECGGDSERTERFFGSLYDAGLAEFDLAGLSFYPYWAGSYEKLTQNMKNIRAHFHKNVVIAETAFPYTDASHDDMQNIVTSELTRETMGLEPSVENQRAVTKRVLETVRAQANGAGVFYWEPVWYRVPGVGVAKGKGNEWENQAMFDECGRALESIRVFET